MEKIIFKDFPKIGNDDPIVGTNFWVWLEENFQMDGNSTYVTALQEYLKPYGFDIQKHRLSGYQIENHKSVFAHFWWTKLNKEN